MTTGTMEPGAPSLDLYLDEPLYDSPQDDEEVVLTALFGRATPEATAPRDWQETLDWCAGQSVKRTKDWTGRCQEFCRTAPGAPGGAQSALDAWFSMPDEARLVGIDPTDAEPGWQIFSRSRNPDALAARFGHVIQVGRDFADRRQSAWSTDALRLGWPDRINPADLYERWNHEVLGAARWQNGVWLDVKAKPIKPVQDTPYFKVGAALVDADRILRKLRVSRDTAKDQKDWADRDRIQTLISHQTKVRKEIAVAFDEMRRAA